MLENPLETPVHIDSMNQVSPTLGSDAIHSGVWSAVIGTLQFAGFGVGKVMRIAEENEVLGRNPAQKLCNFLVFRVW